MAWKQTGFPNEMPTLTCSICIKVLTRNPVKFLSSLSFSTTLIPPSLPGASLHMGHWGSADSNAESRQGHQTRRPQGQALQCGRAQESSFPSFLLICIFKRWKRTSGLVRKSVRSSLHLHERLQIGPRRQFILPPWSSVNASEFSEGENALWQWKK